MLERPVLRQGRRGAGAGDRGAGQPYLVRANGLVLRSAAARLRGDLLHVEPAASAPALRRALREAHVAPLPLAAGRPFVVTFEFDAALASGAGNGRRRTWEAARLVVRPKRSAAPRAALRAALSAGFTGGGWHAEAGPPEEWVVGVAPSVALPTPLFDEGALRLSFHLTNPGLALVQPVLAFASKFRLRVERRVGGEYVREYLKFRIDPDGMRALWDAARDLPPAVSATSASHSDDPD